jgi:hypothetical protein
MDGPGSVALKTISMTFGGTRAEQRQTRRSTESDQMPALPPQL